MNEKIDIATGKHRNTKTWKNESVTWEWLVNRCSKTHRTLETLKEYFAAPISRQAEIKDVGSFVGGALVNGSRKREHVAYRTIITLDADFADSDFWDRFQLFFDCSAFIYSTHKHTEEKHRYRLVILLDREVSKEEYEPIARYVTSTLGIDQFDHTTYDVNRLMYYPSTSKDADFVFEKQKGEPLCADEVLAIYRDWRDISSWPMGSDEKKAIRSGIKKAGDPLEKTGIVGAFCRVHGIASAIETYLADVYVESDSMENRYTYLEGSLPNGLAVYEDKWAYSHNMTDPISGKHVNSFDLVRMHKFGEADARSLEGTPVNRLPSYLAMMEFCTKDKQVKKQLAIEKIEAAAGGFDDDFDLIGDLSSVDADDDLIGDLSSVDDDVDAPDTDIRNMNWLADMDVDTKGNFLTSVNNVELILMNDPKLKEKIGLNEFSGRIGVMGKLPWKRPGNDKNWTDDDGAKLRCYLGKAPYSLKRTPIIEDVVKQVKDERSFHPIKDKIEATVWDGKKRLDTLFIKYLGVTDTPYTRTVSRKTLLAAVTRLYEPGCKFDEVLTLVGPEGCGKSTIIKKLGGEWFSDTFNFSMLSGGNGVRAFEQLQGYWIIEIGEMAGLRKAEAEAAKNFLASSKDSYRKSHGTDPTDFPRKNIFIGTTNNYDFLSSNNGNRRYWPLVCMEFEPARSIWNDLTAYEISQIWAEALAAYRMGETLNLSEEIKAEAKRMQQEHEEVDEWEEIIVNWLDTPVTMSDAKAAFGSEKDVLLNRVCAGDVWVRALNGNPKDINNHNTKRIHSILKNLPNWKPTKSKIKSDNFDGRQRGYERKTSNIPSNFRKNRENLN